MKNGILIQLPKRVYWRRRYICKVYSVDAEKFIQDYRDKVCH